MYSFLKKKIKAIIPEHVLIKNELFFRNIYGVFYIGNKHECNICSNKLSAFVNLNSNDLLCPFCGSLSRNRRLWQLLNQRQDLKGNILHFSPSRSLYRKLKKNQEINYSSSDFENEFIADYQFDVTDINQENEKFDIIICFHILEHIVNDQKAICELYRVLKPEGVIYIQTPFKEGDIYEDNSIVLPEDRTKHFGQHDHVRIYSVEGLKNRLKNNGFKVQEKVFDKQDNDLYLGFKSPETLLIASKK